MQWQHSLYNSVVNHPQLPFILAVCGNTQVLYSTDDYVTDPVLAAVGQLQFEVIQFRMKVRQSEQSSSGFCITSACFSNGICHTHCHVRHPQDEYGVDTTLEPLPYSLARWVAGGWPAIEAAGRLFNTATYKDAYGRPVLLFRNAFSLQQVIADKGDVLGELLETVLPPAA